MLALVNSCNVQVPRQIKADCSTCLAGTRQIKADCSTCLAGTLILETWAGLLVVIQTDFIAVHVPVFAAPQACHGCLSLLLSDFLVIE